MENCFFISFMVPKWMSSTLEWPDQSSQVLCSNPKKDKCVFYSILIRLKTEIRISAGIPFSPLEMFFICVWRTGPLFKSQEKNQKQFICNPILMKPKTKKHIKAITPPSFSKCPSLAFRGLRLKLKNGQYLK